MRRFSVSTAHPSLLRWFLAFIYEAILVFAILFIAGILYRALFGDPESDVQRNVFFAYSWLVVGMYFVYCWTKSGQTLAMKTWRIQLVNCQSKKINLAQAIKRYLCASFSLMFFGLGYVWWLFDREALFLHDRLSGCRLILTPKDSSS